MGDYFRSSRRRWPSADRNRRRRRSTLAKITGAHSVGAALPSGAVVVWLVGNVAANPSSFAFLLFVGVTTGAMRLVVLGFTLSYALIGLINLPHGFVFVSGAALSAIYSTPRA